jgi:hypothetical protein
LLIFEQDPSKICWQARRDVEAFWDEVIWRKHNMKKMDTMIDYAALSFSVV